MNIPYWATLSWWRYVLHDDGHREYGPCRLYWEVMNPLTDDWIVNPFAYAINWCSRLLCRWRGHPLGVYWYSGGLEPDMHCKGCGADLS